MVDSAAGAALALVHCSITGGFAAGLEGEIWKESAMLKMLLAASTLSLAAAGPALANTVRIPYDKADMADPAKVAALYEKVADAAKNVCVNELRATGYRVSLLNPCITITLRESVYATGEPALVNQYKAAQTSRKVEPASATLAMR